MKEVLTELGTGCQPPEAGCSDLVGCKGCKVEGERKKKKRGEEEDEKGQEEQGKGEEVEVEEKWLVCGP